MKFTPNKVIIPASLLVSLLLLFIAKSAEGIWYDFIINMSASMLIIGVTVIIVDLLRESHKTKLYKIPKDTALNKVVGANAVVALSLAVFNRKKHIDIIQGLMNEAKTNDDGSFVNKGTADAIRKLSSLNANEIVADYSDTKLTTELKNTLSRTSDTYTEIMSRYSFSFRDIPLRTDFTELVDHLDAVIQAINVIEAGMTDTEMQKLFKPVDSNDTKSPMTKNVFVGVMLNKYLVCCSKFIDTHIGN